VVADRLSIGTSMRNLSRRGAFQGTTSREAFLVKCDEEMTILANIDLGIVNMFVGSAPAHVRRVRRYLAAAVGRPERRLGRTAMAQFTVNATRFDPYKNFKFRVKWDGRYVAGVSKVGALKRSTEVVEHREGGDPSTSRKSPGRTKYEAITLERGVTHDVEFERWANKVWNYGSGLGDEVSLTDFRKDVIVEMYNEAGQLVIAYKIYRAWVSEYQALPDLDANANAIAIQTIKLENEGWERDYAVAEPDEPSFTGP
jgi:phage tail-like protein